MTDVASATAVGAVTTLGSTVGRALTFWRRSIQARVVASTVVLSLGVIGVVAWLLLVQTRAGLLQHRVDAVLSETANEMAETRARLGAIPPTNTDVASQRLDLMEPLKQRGSARGFAVVLSPAVGGSTSLSGGGAVFAPGLDVASVPAALQEHFAVPAPTAWSYTDVRTTQPGSGVTPGPGIVVGSQLVLPADGKVYTVYFLYPLSEENQTLALVKQALLSAAVALALLVAGLTWLVTRQVVAPVRQTRSSAERLAAGNLEERLQVRGEDDLARLGISFNQMAESLQTQIRQLEELSTMQRRFVSDVSHELRTPLTTVRMASDLLHDSRASFEPGTARAVELLQTELDRFESLLADLLEISRFDAGAAVLELDDVDLTDVARRVINATRSLAAQRGVRLVLEAPGRRCLAEADVRRVERIVRNLVSNAIDHAESGDVLIKVGGDDEAAAIAVRDFGVGLAPGEASQVFNRFWRADPARARTSGGTGLGLSISLEDTHLHGGWLQAWGRPGEGAQFRLTLPRYAGETLRHSPLPLVPTGSERKEPV